MPIDRETHIEAGASAIGAGIGAIAGPLGSVAGAIAAPYLAAAGLQLYERIRGRRVDDVHQPLVDAGIDPNALASAFAEDERSWDVYSVAVEGALRTASERKRRVLGRALVQGLLSHAGWPREQQLRVIQAIVSIEEQDLMVLDFVATRREREISIEGVRDLVKIPGATVDLSELIAQFDAELVDYVIERLESAGMLDPVGTHLAGTPYWWAVTRMGKAVLNSFRESGENAPE